MTSQNSNRAFSEAVYDTYADMLYRISLAHLQNEHDARDAVQDVFVSLMRSNPTFADEEHERAWLIRVTINKCHDIARRRAARRFVPLENLSETPHNGEDPAQAIDVFAGLAALPEKYRTVIVLHYLEGYTTEEIAGILKLSASAVKMRLLRGRELFRMSEKGERR